MTTRSEARIDITEIAAWLESRLSLYLSDLEEMVSIDSGTYDKAGTDAVVALLARRYEGLGATIETHRSLDYGDTVCATLGGRGNGHVLLLGHTDTVYSAGTSAARPLRRDGDRLLGPGVADMKAGNLSIVYALEALKSLGYCELGQIEILHNSDEEIGSPSSRDLIYERSTAADAVLVLEPGRENGDIVWARKGMADIKFTVRGVSAHAGVNHDRGRSAVLEMAHLIVALESLNGSIEGVTVNVAPVRGGERPNVVADFAEGRAEIRAADRVNLEKAVEAARQVAAGRVVDGTSAEVTISVAHYPMLPTDGARRLAELAQTLAGQLGFSMSPTSTGGASDGNTAAQAGCPVLDGLGPIGGAAHSPNEWLSVASIVPRTAVLAGLIAATAARTEALTFAE